MIRSNVVGFVVLLSSFGTIFPLPLPLNEYAYMLARTSIKQHDRSVQAQNDLDEKEKVVNLYLEYLQGLEYQKTKNVFYPARPIERMLDNILHSRFYQFLLPLPKGGNLHLHESQTLSRRIFLEAIRDSPEFDLLHICDHSDCQKKRFVLKYLMANVSSLWTRVKDSNWTIDEIVKRTTLTGILNDLSEPIYATDSAGRWNVAQQHPVFTFYDDLIRYNATRFKYLQLLLDQSLRENVQLIELRRRLFGQNYYFAENGSKVLIPPNDELEMLERFKADYLRNHPKMIDLTFLLYSGRISSKEKIQNDLRTALKLHEHYPNLIRGYDLVGEEDQGHTLLFHNDILIESANYSRLSNGTFNYYFHAGETNWPQDYFPSHHGDAVSTFENVYDALTFRTRRIGHGLSLAKRPDMFEYLRQENITIEICPASNQILGFVADLRNHPGMIFHRGGIPIVLASDDPGSFGYNQLTVDFYLATMAWGLKLADLKQFAKNSIQFSSIPDGQKRIGFQKWNRQWKIFISSTYRFACRRTFVGETISVSNILPSYGPFNRSTNVTLYGVGYERAICKRIFCRFGHIRTIGTLVDINEIVCPTPIGNKLIRTVSLSLIINGETIETGFDYRYLPHVEVVDDGTSPHITTILSDASRITIPRQHYLFILCSLLVFSSSFMRAIKGSSRV